MFTFAVLKWVLLGGVVGFILGLALAHELWRQTVRTKDAVIASLAGKLAESNGKRKRVRG